jgi:hypothetical protein
MARVLQMVDWTPPVNAWLLSFEDLSLHLSRFFASFQCMFWVVLGKLLLDSPVAMKTWSTLCACVATRLGFIFCRFLRQCLWHLVGWDLGCCAKTSYAPMLSKVLLWEIRQLNWSTTLEVQLTFIICIIAVYIISTIINLTYSINLYNTFCVQRQTSKHACNYLLSYTHIHILNYNHIPLAVMWCDAMRCDACTVQYALTLWECMLHGCTCKTHHCDRASHKHPAHQWRAAQLLRAQI